MLGTTDWLLKRFLKFVLKRNVGKYLCSEIDLEQLHVKLDTGKLELKNLLLNCDAINRDLALGTWYVKAGYVGSVLAKIPLVSLSSAQCSVLVNEVVITLALKSPNSATIPSTGTAFPSWSPASSTTGDAFPQDIPASAHASQPPASSAGSAMGFLLADDFGWTGHSAVMDGIKRIAGSLQALLQNMRLEASDVLIRLELPHPSEKGRVVTAALKLDQVEFGDLAAGPVLATATPGPALAQPHPRTSHGHQNNLKVPGAATARQNPDGSSSCDSGNTASGPTSATGLPGNSGRRDIAKHIQVKGLSLDLFETTPLVVGVAAAAVANGALSPSKPQPPASSLSTPGATAPSARKPTQPTHSDTPAAESVPNGSCTTGVTLVSGPGKHGIQLDVDLRMVLFDDPSIPKQISADLRLGAVRLQLLPSHAVCLSALKAALDPSPANALDAAGADSGPTGPFDGTSGSEYMSLYGAPGPAGSTSCVAGGAGHWGQRSLFESLMMPDCEGVVAHTLQTYGAGDGLPYGDASEFHDACSRFGSLASSLVSGVAQTSSTLMGYVAASSNAAVGSAIGWVNSATQAALPSQLPTSSPGAPDTQPRGQTATAATAPASSLFPAGDATAATAPPQLLPPPPIVIVCAHVSHTAFVLCYGPLAPPSAPNPFQHSSGAPRQHGGGSRRVSGSGAGSTRLPRGIAPDDAGQDTTVCSSGSLVLEIHDLRCDLGLDSACGNSVALQAGMLQVYEQLPAEVGARHGMSAAEWSQVSEVLPQAPYHFRPPQPPSLARSCLLGSAGAVLGPRMGARTQGSRTANAPGAAVHGGASLEMWPVLTCAGGSYGTSLAVHPAAPGGGAAMCAGLGKAAGNTATTVPPVSYANGVGSGGGGGIGHSCLHFRAYWGGGGAATESGGISLPSYDMFLEIVPVTVWLSLPLVQRVSDFVAPLAAESPYSKGGGAYPALPRRSASPLPRLSLGVTAPHICALLALLPPSGQSAEPSSVPSGSQPAFLAVDVVALPHPHTDIPIRGVATHARTHLHPSPHQPHLGSYSPDPGSLAGVPYKAAVSNGNHPGLYSNGPTPSQQHHQSPQVGGGWPGHPAMASPGYPSFPTSLSSQVPLPAYGDAASHGVSRPPALGAYAPWGHPAPPPLLALHQVPATDRLIPSQVTTVDLAAGVVELLLVRTAAGGVVAQRQMHHHDHNHDGVQHPSTSSATEGLTDTAGWTSKLLFSLNPLHHPLSSASAARAAWAPGPPAVMPPPSGPSDVPAGCGLFLHVCTDPGVGVAPELVAEAWGHVATHAQDRWADPDGEGGAWEERSSFRCVEFHERCRKSSATFLHLRAPNALLHLTRTDMADLVSLLSALPKSEAASPHPHAATAKPPQRDAWARSQPLSLTLPDPSQPPLVPQTCALLEVSLTIQLQDDPPAAAATADGNPPFGAAAVGGHRTANPCGVPLSARGVGVGGVGVGVAVPALAAHGAGGVPVGGAGGRAAVGPGAAAGNGGGAGISGGAATGAGSLGVGTAGSRVAVYELVFEELTVFRASGLGTQAGANVTSVHAHGVTLMGLLDYPHPHLTQPHAHPQHPCQAAQPPAAERPTPHRTAQHTAPYPHHGSPQAVVHCRGNTQPPPPPAPPPHQRPHPCRPHTAGQDTGASAATVPSRAICLLHCARSTGAADKAPAYIEYVSIEGRPPPSAAVPSANTTPRRSMEPHMPSPSGGGPAMGWSQRTSSSGTAGGSFSTSGGPHSTPTPTLAPPSHVVHSVLLQGLTVSTDHGFVSMDWAVQLGELLSSVAARGAGQGRSDHPPASTSSATVVGVPQGSTYGGGGDAASQELGGGQPPQPPNGNKGRLSVNIVDLALRHEPLEYPASQAPVGTTPGVGGGGGGGARNGSVSLGSSPGAAAGGGGACSASMGTHGGYHGGGGGGVHRAHHSRHTPSRGKAKPGGAGGFAAAGGEGAGSGPTCGGGGSTPAGLSGGHVSPVALALIIEAIHFELPLGLVTEQAPSEGESKQGGAGPPGPGRPPVGGAGGVGALPAAAAPQTVVLHSLTLHLAAADQRGPGWGAGDPRGLREPTLQACGYHRVLQETSIKVVAKQRYYRRRPKPSNGPISHADLIAVNAAATPAAAEGLTPRQGSTTSTVGTAALAGGEDVAGSLGSEHAMHSTLDVEITNQHLLGMLTVESATLLAHFAMQAGTLMTARQAAAAAAAGAAARRDCGRSVVGVPATDPYGDAASEAGSSAHGCGPCSGVCTSEAGGDAAGSLLTALLLDEVEENAFRLVPQLSATSATGGGVSGALAASGHGSLQGPSGAWYGSGAGDGVAAADPHEHPGLILIDDFFPVNHKGEYDEDLMFVQHPPKDGRVGWHGPATKTELEGTWYGPDEGPDRRPSGNGTPVAYPALPAGGLHYSGPQPHPDSASGMPLRAYGGDECGLPSEEAGARRRVVYGTASGGNACLLVEEANGEGGEREEGASCHLYDPVPLDAPGGTDAEGPDIDELLRAVPRAGDQAGVSFGASSPAGGVGAGVGAGVKGAVAPSVVSVGSSVATRSISAPTWRLQENYVRVPRKSDEDGTGIPMAPAPDVAAAGGPDPATEPASAAVDGLAGAAADQPPPMTRIRFKDLSGIWVMHTTRTSPPAGAAPGTCGPAANGCHVGPGGAAGSAPGGGYGGSSASGQQEGRVELVIEGLGLQLESYGPGGHLARHMKLTVHDLEIRDCALDVRQQQAAATAGSYALAAVGGAGSSGGAAGRGGWVRVLGYRSVRGQPRDSRTPLVAVALTAVRPNPAACDPRDEEFRLAVALLPLRLKLDQDVMSYLAWYGTSVSNALKPAAAVLAGMQASLSELGGCDPLPPPYFQRAQIRGFTVMLDYRPRRVDISALAEGRLSELINLVPLGGVELACKPLRLAGLQGWDGLGTALLSEWLNDIARTQAHKFITGLAPVNAVVKVGSAVATLVAAPARHFARRDGGQLATQLRRTSVAFAHRLVLEAMTAGRKAASGAGRALARVGSSTLAAYGVQGYEHSAGDDGMYGGYDDEDECDDEGHTNGDDECDDGEALGSGRGSLRRHAHHDGGGAGGGANAQASGGGGGGGSGGMRRSRSASAMVRKGLAKAAKNLGSASQHVAAGLQNGGLQRGVSNVARVLSAAAASGVSAAAPASAVLHGQLTGTLRSVKRALRAQLGQSGSGTGGGGNVNGNGNGNGNGAAGMYPTYPHAKED